MQAAAAPARGLSRVRYSRGRAFASLAFGELVVRLF